MDKLIKALQVFLKYGNPAYPTHCEHDVFMVVDMPSPDRMSTEDVAVLLEHDFFWSSTYDCWISYKFGSA